MAWDPDRYGEFAEQRLRPAFELLARVRHDGPHLVVDLGCGAGEPTRAMADRWPDAKVLGVDNSPEMLAVARSAPSAVQWVEADLTHWEPPGPVDVVYANASLHWVDGHAAVLERLVGWLAPGGVLAVQMPLSWDEPSHHALRDVLHGAGVDGGPLGGARLRARYDHRPVADPMRYYDFLSQRMNEVDVWVTRYLLVLEGPDPVLRWVSGSTLRPLLAELDGDDRQRFLAAYRERLARAYPRRRDGTTIYPFPRLFIVGGV